MASNDTFDLLPEHVQRMLGDRSYERRKTAALTVESTIKTLEAQDRAGEVRKLINLLGDNFTRSSSANNRKGGLIGLAAAAIGLMKDIYKYLPLLLPPVIQCFSDPESRVRYYACEALFNIAKVARQKILESFNEIFNGLCELYSDVDPDVKNGAQLLDRLVKEIVTESDSFNIEKFIPLLHKKLKTRNPYIRSLLVGWITVLDSVPFINMLDYLPHFLEGLFNMLSDDIREIRQQADHALNDFMQEIKDSNKIASLQLSEIVDILVRQSGADQVRFNRLTAIQWIEELVLLGRERLKSLYAKLLDAILRLLADEEGEIRSVAKDADVNLRKLVQVTEGKLDFSPLLRTLKVELVNKDETTRIASLAWISMLLERDAAQVLATMRELFPILVDNLLCDVADPVVMGDLDVLARIACDEDQFNEVLTNVIRLFRVNRDLLESRGTMIIRNLCLQLDSKKIFMTLARILLKEKDLSFASVMIQTLNRILLTSDELLELRRLLQTSFVAAADAASAATTSSKSYRIRFGTSSTSSQKSGTSAQSGDAFAVFKTLYASWCHNAVSTFSLCLLAQAYSLSAALVGKFGDTDVTLGFLMQIDRLVQLLESPIFVRLRLQLLEPDRPYHGDLMKSLFGILMLLPQSAAFKTLRERLTSISSLYIAASHASPRDSRTPSKTAPTVAYVDDLLEQFVKVRRLHTEARIADLRSARLDLEEVGTSRVEDGASKLSTPSGESTTSGA
eukprot:g2228.t1